ncbi:hypothetical protein AJ80_05184 [Polytolypa hystricis UAMH7299]|uniref:ABC transporter domain-containing protein n=1 Tax=Polytolypa hystricis (strain UAMH7299) TaxID=1447883 RepID=A0A2B7Y5X6_POLH7|nr:hypothetical protein AJ80_05184 [Polytolypa hystricis UAMH7299]
MELHDANNAPSSRDNTNHASSSTAVGNNGNSPCRQSNSDTGFAPIRSRSPPKSQHDVDGTTSASLGRSTSTTHTDAEWTTIQRAMSKMFGRERREGSEEEKTRHVGVVWKHLTVKGVGQGAILQKTNADIFLALPKFLGRLITGGKKKAIRKEPVRTIIDDFTGCVRPGEMLLVLGRPGSGCSTFLKALGNQRVGFESVEGEVTYGGTDAARMAKNYRSEVLYNPEDDLHYAALTVKETLSFALKTRTPGKESRNEGESRSEYRKTFLQAVSKLFWIEHCLDTRVGNQIIRGVSGGEKKRVSIAEALITKASTQCWDNSTRGLDASTALEYVQSLRSLTNMAEVSTLVAIYQASESLYKLFDKVVLLDEGKCIYFGPTSDAKAYFEGLGFECPPRWTTADFLTSVTESYARRVKEGWEHRIPRSPQQFKQAYLQSEIRKETLRDIEDFEQETAAQGQEREAARNKTAKKNFTIPFHHQVLALSHRQVLIMVGDRQSLFGKFGVVLFLALIVGSLFYNLPQDSRGIFTRGGVMFFMILFNALLAMAELTSSFEHRPILLKHKSFSFYRPSAYALAQVVVDVPMVFIQVTIFNIIVYFMAHLARTPSQFFINFLFIWLVTMTMYSFFRAIGALCTSLDVATRITGVAIQALVVYTGYLIPPDEMRPWLKWLIWINPVQYTFASVMSNEFYNLDLQCVPPNLVPQGPNTSPQYQSCLVQGSQPGQTAVKGANYILSNYTYSRSQLWRNFGIIIAWFVLFVVVTMIGTERQKQSHGGRSVSVYMRGQAPKSVERDIKGVNTANDEETGEKESVFSNSVSSSDSASEKVEGVAQSAAVFTWRNINYKIPYKGGEKKLLQDVQGYVKPGHLTALVGASGSGKTTLLNALAQRIDFGILTGEFLIDGKPLPKSFQRATGFAEQADIHEPTATVREALRFSALLRRPKHVPIQEKYDYCEKIIVLLELQPIAGAIIGDIGAGLNQEQRKRVTIAVELAGKPDLLLFLDEPTSGLDSLAALNIVRFLRKLTDVGQAVLCTIHQPSAVLFEHFDELLLLQSGGRVVYHGELGTDSRKMIGYFERNGGKKCEPDANPAEYMLEVIGAGNPDYEGQDWADVWTDSPEHEQRTKEIEEVIQSSRDQDRIGRKYDEHEYAMPLWVQVVATSKRTFVSYWRTPNYAIGKFMLQIWTGLFNTFTFWHLSRTTIAMQSRLFSCFLTLVIAPPLIQQLQPRYLHFRGLYEAREARSKIYSWFAFVTSTILPELPYSTIAGSVYFCCWYFGTWFPRDSFSATIVWMYTMLFACFYVGFGQMIASFAGNELLASFLVPAFFTFVVSFCGVVVPYAALPTFWRSWMYWLTPFHYLLEGYLGVVTNGVPVECSDKEYARFPHPPGTSCEEYVRPFVQKMGGYIGPDKDGLCSFCQYANGNEFAGNTFNVFYKHKWRNYGIFFGYVIFNFAAVYVISWLYLHGVPELRRRMNARKMRMASQ